MSDSSLLQRLPGILAFPARAGVFGWICALALAALGSHFLLDSLSVQWWPQLTIGGSPGSVFSFVLGLLIESLLAILAMKLALEALLDSAGDKLDPGQAGTSNATDSQAIWQLFLWLGGASLVYLALLWVGWTGAGFTLALALLVLPAAIMLLAVDENLGHALNPFAWSSLVARLGLGYFAIAGALGLLALLAIGAQVLLFSRLPSWLEVPASRFVVLYALLVGYHLLGDLLFRQRESLGLDISPVIERPVLANAEEDRILRESEWLLADQQPAAAAACLGRLIRGRGASAPIHQRYRQLLIAAGDSLGLSQHGRDYIATLLTLGQDKSAMALLVESLALDPAFQMESPEEISRLIAHAAATGQSQMAVRLAEQFASRFPRDRELVQNSLLGARLMAERLGRDGEARQWLSDLLQRFPEHPLAAAMRASLLEIEQRSK